MRAAGGRDHELSPDFAVLYFGARDRRDRRKYATVGMATAEHPIELFVYVPCDDDEGQTELLAAIGHFHRTGSPLGAGHTVNFGRPWMRGSLCEYGLLSMPYLEEVGLGGVPNSPVRYLWLLPITPAERAFKISAGLEALEQRFEEARIRPEDPTRPSAV